MLNLIFRTSWTLLSFLGSFVLIMDCANAFITQGCEEGKVLVQEPAFATGKSMVFRWSQLRNGKFPWVFAQLRNGKFPWDFAWKKLCKGMVYVGPKHGILGGMPTLCFGRSFVRCLQILNPQIP